MCGIAGIFNFKGDSVDPLMLKKMTDSIEHRGPDGEGHWINAEESLGLGHRRLAIIDLSENGKQPFQYSSGRYTITYNGEIYNYPELRKKLQNKGYTFRSETDTEVLLALYDLKAEKCLEDLDGMFSFALWDGQKQELFCARDRFGEKPFYYCLDGNRMVFGSEIKQFWAIGHDKVIDERRFKEFLENGSPELDGVPEETYYTNIKTLEAAHFLVVQSKGTIIKKRYWHIDLDKPEFTGTIEEAVGQFRSLFTTSILRRLRADVAVGSSLSGGLDSSSIVMLINSLKDPGQIQKTFSARFKDFNKDEGKHIEKIVGYCKNLEAYATWPDEEYFVQSLNKVAYHQDEPFSSTSIVAQYAVMDLAKQQNVTVLLDGQGADEYLAGYFRYYKTYLNQLLFTDKMQFRSEETGYTELHGKDSPYTSYFKTENLRMKLGRYKNKMLGRPDPFSKKSLKSYLKNDVEAKELRVLLRYSDRNSMAHSREVRTPFLSHELVEFVFTLPDNFILSNGWSKFLLRKALEPVLPPEICWRIDKVGYEPPQKTWMKNPEIQDQVKKAYKTFEKDWKERTPELDYRVLIASKYV